MERRLARTSRKRCPPQGGIQDEAPVGAPSPSAWPEEEKESRLARAVNNRAAGARPGERVNHTGACLNVVMPAKADIQ
jgi:hypothetical protein